MATSSSQRLRTSTFLFSLLFLSSVSATKPEKNDKEHATNAHLQNPSRVLVKDVAQAKDSPLLLHPPEAQRKSLKVQNKEDALLTANLEIPWHYMNAVNSAGLLTPRSKICAKRSSERFSGYKHENLVSSSPSTSLRMFLCDHPPKTFSPDFLGFPYKACMRFEKKRVMPFKSTLTLCKIMYNITEGNPELFEFELLYSPKGALRLITQEKFIRICLPLFQRFNKCEEKEYHTICWDERVIFLHTINCSKSVNDAFLAGALLNYNNTKCFKEFCEDRQNLVDSEVDGVMYRLMSTFLPPTGSTCAYLVSFKIFRKNHNGTMYLITNKHWPCCYPNYLVIWAGLPEAHGLNGAWSYLPASCQAGEVLLLVMVVLVAVGSVGGNLLVVMVMVSGGHRRQESSLLRTSLATADLLTAMFVVVPSFFKHMAPFLVAPSYLSLSKERLEIAGKIDIRNITKLPTHFSESGFPVFQSVLFNITSTVSLLTLLVLSLERFVITGRFLRYMDYFSFWRAIMAIIITWTTSLVNSLWFAAHHEGHLSAQWLTFEKLPTGASGEGPGGVRMVIYHGQFVIFLVLGISVVIFSALAIKNFIKEQMHVSAEWRTLKMKASVHYNRDNRHVLTTMMLMLLVFLVTTVPLAVNIVMNSFFFFFHQQSLFSYLAWWLFVAASALNPWVYNVRSHQFRQDAVILFRRWKRQMFCTWWRRPYVETQTFSSNLPSEVKPGS